MCYASLSHLSDIQTPHRHRNNERTRAPPPPRQFSRIYWVIIGIQEKMKNHRWLNCTEFSFFWVCSGRKFMNDCICVLADMLVLNFFFGEVSLADPDQVEPWRFGRQRG